MVMTRTIQDQAYYRDFLLRAATVLPWDCMQFAADEAGFILVPKHKTLERFTPLVGADPDKNPIGA